MKTDFIFKSDEGAALARLTAPPRAIGGGHRDRGIVARGRCEAKAERRHPRGFAEGVTWIADEISRGHLAIRVRWAERRTAVPLAPAARAVAVGAIVGAASRRGGTTPGVVGRAGGHGGIAEELIATAKMPGYLESVLPVR